jgi:hypothetical protein
MSAGRYNGSDPAAAIQPWSDARIVTLEEFVDVDEPGARPLVGDDDGILIPEGSDVMLYGNGGAGKTTLSIDLACHLAAGDDWLAIPVPQPIRVLIIENEGPRPLLRRKLRRKQESWQGSPLRGRVTVFERPWGEFSFSMESWRAKLAEIVRQREVEVIIAGPLTRIGMDVGGTLPEVTAFVRLIDEVRRLCGRPLTVILIHHENKGGQVSGAWEGAGDTLLHVQAAGNGHTIVFVQKARWDSLRTQTTIKLGWTDGEGFKLEGDRDYRAEIESLLSDRPWLTPRQISLPRDADPPGIGASVETVKAILNADPECFEARSGDDAKAVGRHPNATVYALRRLTSPSRTHKSDSPNSDFLGGAGNTSDSDSLLKRVRRMNHTPTSPDASDLDGEVTPEQPQPMGDESAFVRERSQTQREGAS